MTQAGDSLGLTLLGRIRETLEALTAELLVALSCAHLPILGAGLIQCLVGILVVRQGPQSPVQQVLRRSATHRLSAAHPASLDTPGPLAHLGCLGVPHVVAQHVGEFEVFV